ncbi:hypothetical protein ERHA55_53430 (plasmid) [Erwinia rhapontici]|nr:hypothetical protein ERHA55_53430 [Erwinia rhapontici]
MTDDMSFEEDKNAWLLTLPEITSGGRYLPTCTVVVLRTLRTPTFRRRDTRMEDSSCRDARAPCRLLGKQLGSAREVYR